MKKQVLFIVLMLMPLMVSAQTNINGIYYWLNSTDKVAEVTSVPPPPLSYSYSMYTGSVVIPKTVTYGGVTCSVTSIGDRAFSGCSGLTSITIPNSVTSIGDGAFYDCSGLTSVTIPNSVTSIDEYAFSGCSGLTSIIVENGNVVYDSRNNCNAIIKTSTNELVAGCKSTIILNSVTSIGEAAFSGCSGLTSITIPNSVISIGYDAFYGCSGLTSVHITDLAAWCKIAFLGEDYYDDFGYYPNYSNPLRIAHHLFLNGTKVENLIIPNGVTSIGKAAFRGCSDLTSVTIPTSVTSIGCDAFYGCSGLTSVNISDIAAWCNVSHENYDANPLSYAHHLFLNGEEVKDLVIPNNVTSIREDAFFGCTSIEKITLHCQEIGSWFSNLRSVKEVIIGDEVKSIVGGAFDGCTSIEKVTFHCQEIGSWVGNLRSVKEVIIGDEVKSIVGDAFNGCSNLESVNISDIAAWCKFSFSYLSYGHLFLNGEEVKDLVVPNSVTSIGNSTFSGCSGLTYVTIPNSVTSIGNSTFSGCSGLTYVTIPNSVTSIGDNVFQGCSKLSSVSIGKGIKSVGTKAFANCPEIKEVYCYAKDVPTISNDTFENSYYIKWATLYVPESSVDLYKASAWSQFGAIEPLTNEILFADDAVKELCVANWDTTNDGELGVDEAAAVTDLSSIFANNTDIISFDELQYFTGLTSIGEQAFYYCSNLKSIIIPKNVTAIGNRAFYVCSGLKSLRIPANVSSIEDRAFAYCSGLETIEVDVNNQYYDSRNNCNALIQTNSNTLLVGCKNTIIPSNVKAIAEGAFRGSTELASIEIPEGVTTIGASAFRGCTGLTSVTLPSTITSIGNYAFSAVEEVYNLTSVTVGMTTPVTITSEVFPNRANSTLYVPKGCMAAYKAANYWKEFKNIVELDNGIPVKCEKPVITLLANGKIKVESATEGATCVTNITASNAEPLSVGEISLNTPLVVYTVTSHATKEGYDDSEVATATFRYEKTEGDINGDGMLNITDVIHLVNMILGQ